MPVYHVEVNLSITSSHGRRPVGGGIAAMETQLVQVYCKYRCAESTVTKRATTIARQNALNALVAYSVSDAFVRTVSARVVSTT